MASTNLKIIAIAILSLGGSCTADTGFDSEISDQKHVVTPRAVENATAATSDQDAKPDPAATKEWIVGGDELIEMGADTSSANPGTDSWSNLTTKEFLLKVSGRENSAQLLLIIDDSSSMTTKIAMLQKNLGALVDRLRQDENGFKIRFLKLSTMYEMLHSPPSYPHHAIDENGSDSTMFPTVSFLPDGTNIWIRSFKPLNYETPFRRNTYGSTKVFAETTPVDQLKEFIGSIKAKSFEREMGVALAFDYLNWATFGVAGNQEIKKDERLHIVVLSNEDDVDTPLTTTWFGPRGGQFYMYYESQTTVRFSAVHDRSTAFLASEFCLADAFKGRENEIKQLANVNPETHICKYSDRATEQFSPVGLSGYTQCKTYYSKCPRVIDGFADFYEFPSPQIGCEVMTTRTSVQSYMVASVPGWLEKWIVKKEDGSFDCQYIDVSCKLAAVFKHELKFGAADGKNRLEEIRTKPCDVGFSRSMYDSPQQVFAAKDYQLASRVTYPDSISPRVTPGRRLTFIESFSDHVTLEEAARRIAAKYPNMDVSGMEIVEESSKSIGYKPTPENFMSLQDKIVPGRDVTWHAIVNLSGQRCAGDGEESGTVSKGADYIRLAEMTGGVVADICAPKFEDFLEAIGSKVTTELEKSYDLRLVTGEVDFAGWHVKQVRRGSVILKVGQDYFVEGANLRFSPRVLARDCEFVVTIGKR